MDTKDKCEKIIQALNGTIINGAKDPLLIKFADGGPKKRLHKSDVRLWRDTEVLIQFLYAIIGHLG